MQVDQKDEKDGSSTFQVESIEFLML